MSRAKDPRIAALRRSDFFASLRDKQLAEVAKLCDAVTFLPGTDLMRQGGRAGEAFIIASGEASVVVDGTKVATVGAGEVLGEIALLDHGRRTATVIADTPVEAFVIAPREFHALLDDFPVLARKVSTELSQRLRAADRSHATS